MKRVLFSVAILAASVCVADEITSSNVLGLLPITSSAKRTIVAVPWCAMSATDNAAIQVSNVVKTANLEVGNLLHYVNSTGAYDTWKLALGDNDVKYWASVQSAGEDAVVVNSSPSSVATVARGNCIVLIRNAENQDLTKPFYLYGQVATTDTDSSVIVKGTSPESPAYSLIASPKPAAWSVNGGTWANVGAGDNIFVPGANGWNICLYWDPTSSKWGTSNDVYTTVGGQNIRTGVEFAEYNTLVPAGQGVWYVSNGGTETPSVIWSDDLAN